MLSEPYKPVRELLRECEQLAQARFHLSVRVDVGIVPTLSCDFWSADVRLADAPGSTDPLLKPVSWARSKSAALSALRDALLALPNPSRPAAQ